jgi:hypothetical protein
MNAGAAGALDTQFSSVHVVTTRAAHRSSLDSRLDGSLVRSHLLLPESRPACPCDGCIRALTRQIFSPRMVGCDAPPSMPARLELTGQGAEVAVARSPPRVTREGAGTDLAAEHQRVLTSIVPAQSRPTSTVHADAVGVGGRASSLSNLHPDLLWRLLRIRQ